MPLTPDFRSPRTPGLFLKSDLNRSTVLLICLSRLNFRGYSTYLRVRITTALEPFMDADHHTAAT